MKHKDDLVFDKLVWHENFSAYEGVPDPEKWFIETGIRNDMEAQYYTAESENVSVKGGVLNLTAVKKDCGSKPYTSGSIKSVGKGWKYGRFDICAKLPAGIGMWPAIWMMPVNSEYGNWPRSGEIDIMEQVGCDPTVIHGTLHTGKFSHLRNTDRAGYKDLKTATSEFHIYSIEWQPSHMDFFVDDELYYSVVKGEETVAGYENEEDRILAWPFDKEFFLILNTAVGGGWAGMDGIDDEKFPQGMEVKYVKIYQ